LEVLVTDVVSSDTLMALGSVPEDQLPGLFIHLIRQFNYFYGIDPSVLLSLFRKDPALSPRVESEESLRPWLWHFGPRVYAIWGVKFRKRGGMSAP
jgi:hypothetical protein